MKIGPFELSWGKKPSTKSSDGLTIDQVIGRLEAAYRTAAGVAVTPENCMTSPTMAAIVTAISRRISTLPILVMTRTESQGRTTKELLPNHPVARLLKRPNSWQDPSQFWLDATSQLVRWGNFIAVKSRGQTGPIRELLPINPGAITITQETDWTVLYRGSQPDGVYFEARPDQILHARGPARDSVRGDSTVMDIRQAIGLEIQAEMMGGSVFGNSAVPGMVLKYAEGFAGHATDEERRKFVAGLDDLFTREKRHSTLLLPKGIEVDSTAPIDNEKAQYIATRQYQRTVIAAAFGVPVHMVGDLSKGTFNNVEQQTLDFVINVVLPYCRMFENAMEWSLLTPADRAAGIIIRFDLEGILRGDFKSRQEGLNIQRQAGVISANDWREKENMNPISAADGGNEYWRKGPSGQDATAPGAQPGSTPAGGQAPNEEPGNEDTDPQSEV